MSRNISVAAWPHSILPYCRLYKYDSGQLNRVSLPEDTLSALTEPKLDLEWSKLVDPAASAESRDALAANLFSLPTDGEYLTSVSISESETSRDTCSTVLLVAVQSAEHQLKPGQLCPAESTIEPNMILFQG